MASRVEGFDEAILCYARTEFLEKGFADASLRTIAQNAGVSTSTIYTRYADKEGLFRYLIKPASEGMKEFLASSLNQFEALPKEEQKDTYKECSNQGFPKVLDLIYAYFDEFKLLISCAPNNLYHDFIEELVEIDTQCTKHFLENMGSEAYQQGRITDGFLHVVSSAFYSGLFEVVIHDMPREEAVNYVNELRTFYNSGWKEYF